jgi:metal-responsive CopG/Arc/MetJ family transcriptional regulator
MAGPKKPRNRGAVYPVEILVRLTAEMGERMDQIIEADPTQTRVGIIRKALDKYLPKKKKTSAQSSETDD